MKWWSPFADPQWPTSGQSTVAAILGKSHFCQQAQTRRWQNRKRAQNDSHCISSNENYLIKHVMLMIKGVFLTVKVAYFENESVILTILGHTEGPWVSKVSEVICYFSMLWNKEHTPSPSATTGHPPMIFIHHRRLKSYWSRICHFSKNNMFLLEKKNNRPGFMTLVPYKQHVFPLPLSLSDKDGQTDGGTDESWANKRGSAPRLVLRLRGSNLF